MLTTWTRHLWVAGFVACLILGQSACGDDDTGGGGTDVTDDQGGGDGGTDLLPDTEEDGGGEDVADEADTPPETLMCGAVECENLIAPTPIGDLEIEACCPPDVVDVCGLDTSLIGQVGLSFEEPCQEVDQDGELDSECPVSPDIDVPVLGAINFEGCCRPEGQCGYLVDNIEALGIALGLGCVETPFEDDDPGTCTPGDDGGDADMDAGGSDMDMGQDLDVGNDTGDTGSDTADTGSDTADTGNDADTGSDTADTDTDTGT